jgi:hypothetical protein
MIASSPTLIADPVVFDGTDADRLIDELEHPRVDRSELLRHCDETFDGLYSGQSANQLF